MGRAWSVGAQGLTVGGGAVSPMAGKSVLGIALVQFEHEPVTVRFRYNRGCGNGVNIPVSLLKSGLRYRIVRQQPAVYQHVFGLRREMVKSQTHGFSGRPDRY